MGMSAAMKDPYARFFAIEHLTGMLIAIILLHIGKAQGKKAINDRSKHRRTLVFYLLALLIILLSIPWPFRQIGARAAIGIKDCLRTSPSIKKRYLGLQSRGQCSPSGPARAEHGRRVRGAKSNAS